jgi:CrcB protein
MRDFLLVALGGALGASGRYGVALAAARWSEAFPWPTLLVNIAGGLAMGALVAATDRRDLILLFGVGVLGGFTTFSAFSIETVRLIERGAAATALAYATASVVLSVGAAFAGMTLMRSLP